ncbi:MAG TPA: hypothetical protein VK543_16960 [Puia sp.]|nr:hypothetical protein [Puia sp.]
MQKTILCLLILISFSCRKNTQKAKVKADELLEQIAKGNALNEFPEKNFPRDQSILILKYLQEGCDFKNRKGHFINDFYQKDLGGIDQVSFIYEFYLKCDSIRIVLTYNISDTLELLNFKLVTIKEDNKMILKPERRLINQ